VHGAPEPPHAGPLARAELIEDRGAAASSDEFFRSPAYLDAEGATHTLRVASPGREALLPVIVRPIEGTDLLDAISPYGYPGALVRGGAPAPDPTTIDWGEVPLVSVFARERLAGAPWLARPSEHSRLLIHDPSLPRRIRPRLAQQIRANARDGWDVQVTAGPSSAPAERAAFVRAYAETMARTGATHRYLFAERYFDAALSFERSWLLLARRRGQPGAGAIVATSDGHLHYFLGATADAALAASPFKNLVAAMLDLAEGLATPLNLGGGVAPGDGLERFKRGFANSRAPFRVHRVICDPDAYARLSGQARASEKGGASGAGATEAEGGAAGADATEAQGGAAGPGFFPAYRAPTSPPSGGTPAG
jgi:hypothetical protein